MSARFKTIALFGRPQSDGLDARILEDIENWLRGRGLEVLTQTSRNTRLIGLKKTGIKKTKPA